MELSFLNILFHLLVGKFFQYQQAKVILHSVDEKSAFNFKTLYCFLLISVIRVETLIPFLCLFLFLLDYRRRRAYGDQTQVVTVLFHVFFSYIFCLLFWPVVVFIRVIIFIFGAYLCNSGNFVRLNLLDYFSIVYEVKLILVQ